MGGGDPTLSTQPRCTGYPTVASLPALARAVAERLPAGLEIAHVVGSGNRYGGPEQAAGWSDSYLADGEVAPVRSLIADEDKATPGLGPSVRAGDPVVAATQTFQAELGSLGARVAGAQATTGALPPAAKLLASVVSPPVSALVERMLTYSDDDVAEGLGRQVALRAARARHLRRRCGRP